MRLPFDTREIALASAILQGLVQRGEFGDTAFDQLQQWHPRRDGSMHAEDASVSVKFSARLLGLVTVALNTARLGLAITEERVSSDDDDEEAEVG